MKKIFSILLSMLCVCTVATSCFGGSGEDSTSSLTSASDSTGKNPNDSTEAPVIQEDGSESLLGFEQVDELLKSVVFSANESKIELSNDKKYVTQGEYCAKMKLNQSILNHEAYYYDSTFQVLCNTKYLKKQDYTDVAYLGIDIYNNTGYAVEFLLSLSNRFQILHEATLNPGANTLMFYLDQTALNYSEVAAFDFNFKGLKADQAPLEIYVDNFRAYAGAGNQSFNDKKDDFAGENWYCFEEGRDANLFWQFGTSESVFSMPRTSINRDKRYISQGNGSMRIDFKQKKDGTMDVTSIRSADYEMGNLNKYVGDENWYITFDVYNASDEPIELWAKVFSAYNNEQYGVSCGTIQPGTWSDKNATRIYINDLKSRFTGVELNVLTVIFGFDGMTKASTVYMDNFVLAK